MGEKGSDRQRSSNSSNAVYAKKGHVRIIKNSHMVHGPQVGFRSLASSPIKSNGKGCHSPQSFVIGGSAKKGKRLNESLAPPLSMSPTSRNGVVEVSTSPRNTSPRSSPSLGCHYAGAKFSEPPSPDSLPKPPTHWNMTGHYPGKMDCFLEISQQLKMILKVQA